MNTSISPFLASRTCATTGSPLAAAFEPSPGVPAVAAPAPAPDRFTLGDLASAGRAPGTTVIAPARPAATVDPFRNLRRSKPSILSPLENETLEVQLSNA